MQTILDNWGLTVSGGGTLAMLLYRIIRSKDFRTLMIRFIKALFNGFIGRHSISHHLFYNSSYYITLANNITFTECDTKTKLFRITIDSIIKVVILETKKWLKNNRTQILKLNKLQLRDELSTLTLTIKVNCETHIKEEYFKYLRSDRETTKAFDIIYSGTDIQKGIEQFIQKYYDDILNYIKIMPSYVTSTNSEILYQLFSLFDTMLGTLVQNSEQVFSAMNGSVCKKVKK